MRGDGREPLYVPILLGLKIDSFSMNPVALPRVKNLIRRSSMKECCRFVEKVIRMRTALEIQQAVSKTGDERNFRKNFGYSIPTGSEIRRFRS